MDEYFISVLLCGAAVAVCSYLSYPGASERVIKAVSGVLLFYAVFAPIVGVVGEISDLPDENIFAELEEIGKVDGAEYENVARDAFALGIKRLISSEYGIKEENITVTVFGFDFKEMRSERINVVLRGTAVSSDFRGIRDYLNKLGLGECEVRVELGS